MFDWIDKCVLQHTGASSIISRQVVQELWSGYGQIIRFELDGGHYQSVIVKHIGVHQPSKHPRGWGSSFSHQRKLRSYQVELSWYENYNSHRSSELFFPRCLLTDSNDDQKIIIMEDLDTVGYPVRLESAGWNELKICLEWLACFHACFMGRQPKGLWEVGSYWHLATRPDEWNTMADGKLKELAPVIAKKLEHAKYQTFVHGDAKLANFCFDPRLSQVAAVDFQYVGGGCGMKDVAYLVGSCLDEKRSQEYESRILDAYFTALRKALKSRQINFDELEEEWRYLYHFAWVDFTRFLKGWSPGHWKNNAYTESLVRRVLKECSSSMDL